MARVVVRHARELGTVRHRVSRELAVRPVRIGERELLDHPALQAVVGALVVARLVGVGCDPPADVDVVAGERLGELATASHRIEIGAAEVPAVGVSEHVRERIPLAELALVPDQVDEVEVGGDRLLRPPAAAGAPDQVEAGVDPAHVVVEVRTAEHRRHDVLVGEPKRRIEPVREDQLLHVPSHRPHSLASVAPAPNGREPHAMNEGTKTGRTSVGVAIAIGAVIGLALGILVSVTTDSRWRRRSGASLGALVGWLVRRDRSRDERADRRRDRADRGPDPLQRPASRCWRSASTTPTCCAGRPTRSWSAFAPAAAA